MIQASPRHENVDLIRRRVISLAGYQVVLRDKLKSRIAEVKATDSDVAKASGLQRHEIESFLKGDRVFVGKKNIANITAYVEDSELGGKMSQLAADIPDRFSTFVRFEPNVIDIAFDLIYAYKVRVNEFSMVEFADAFDGYSRIIYGVLTGSRDALEFLRATPTAIQEILDTLADEELLDKRLAEIKKRVLKEKQPKIDQINQLIDVLLPIYGTKVVLVRELELGQNNLNQSKLIEASDAQLDRFITALTAAAAVEHTEADDLGVLEEFRALYHEMREAFGSQRAVADALEIAASTLSDATRGRVSHERLADLCGKAKTLVSDLKESQGDPSPITPESAAEATTPTLEVVENPLGSPEAPVSRVEQEAQVVQVPLAFQGLPDDDEDIDALLEALKKSLRRSGALLYAVARLKDPEMRARMSRPDVQRLINEVNMALELATASHPGALTGLFEARREHLESRFASHPKKGAK